jgi:cytochrome oxidase Cu insertion factor (SCO1/SenC/PrrC family)
VKCEYDTAAAMIYYGRATRSHQKWMGGTSNDAHANHAIAKHYSCFAYAAPLRHSRVMCLCM